MITPSPITIQP